MAEVKSSVLKREPIRFSVLDLAPIVEGRDAATALANTIPLAQLAEQCGFTRYWLAEHHNMQGIASSATSVVIGHVAAATKTIRVGSGGVMLPNHAPLLIAEQFGTLATLYPNRIDLGVGRAPGTDQQTAYALRRTMNGSVDNFPRDIRELQYYFDKPESDQKVFAVPGTDTQVPIWILGSSLYGAQLAALFGLPFGFASHFAPAMMHEAIDIYRATFKPSEQLEKPYVMLGYNVCVADTAERATYLRSSGLQSYLRMQMGKPARLPPPIEDFEANLDPTSKAAIRSARPSSISGDVATVREGLQTFVDETGADELILVSQIYDFNERLHSFRLAAEAAKGITTLGRKLSTDES